MESILASVGRGGRNSPDDVKVVQRLLSKIVTEINLVEDGRMGPKTIAGLAYFQGRYVGLTPSGIVYPNDSTLIELNKGPCDCWRPSDRLTLPPKGNLSVLKLSDYELVANELKCELDALRAIAMCESRGGGFLPDGRPKILFEAHHFAKKTDHQYNDAFPDISSRSWNRKLYSTATGEYKRLAKAMALDRSAALQSTSWGTFQLMGFNHVECGFGNSVEAMIKAMFQDEVQHLKAFKTFLVTRSIVAPLIKKDWHRVAFLYNGKRYAENLYHLKLQANYEKLSKASKK